MSVWSSAGSLELWGLWQSVHESLAETCLSSRPMSSWTSSWQE